MNTVEDYLIIVRVNNKSYFNLFQNVLHASETFFTKW